MTSRTLIALIVLAAALALEPFLRPHVSHAPVYSFPVTLANGTHTPLSALIGGKVALLVNVASNCGLTPQYSGLERLYREKKDAGFEIVAFPCNQFGGQEPGSIDEIQNFCSKKFDVTFQLTEKVEVNGENADPLWKHLKSARPGVAGTKEIEWNFAKFLIDRDGNVAHRFLPTTTPDAVASYVDDLLASKPVPLNPDPLDNFKRIGRMMTSWLGL